MTYFQLLSIQEFLSQYNYIKRARRVENNLIEMDFGDKESVFFDMTRSNSTVMMGKSKRPLQDFNAPFDTLLHQLISQSKIKSVKVLKGERVLQIEVLKQSRYKEQYTMLQLEFTGKYTNAILLDNNGIVIEALHHIDISSSFRVVRPGVELQPLPIHKIKLPSPPKEPIDAKELLQSEYKKRNQIKLKSLKRQKLSFITKKISRLQKILDGFESEEKLLNRAKEYRRYAEVVLANLHKINHYDKSLSTYDFEGNPINIPLPKGIKKSRISDYYYKLAKRYESKARHIHIERDNIESKIAFYENIKEALINAKEPWELELLVPKKANFKKRKEKLRDGELYWIDGYKVYVGRNSKENKKLLEMARSNDIWMHTRGIPSSHVIIRTDKQNLPESLLKSAAKLCVDFSIKQPGNYEVDYTKRKFVKIQEGSRVEYDKYKTISVLKEGIEIRED